jgi:hypothetical protein
VAPLPLLQVLALHCWYLLLQLPVCYWHLEG